MRAESDKQVGFAGRQMLSAYAPDLAKDETRQFRRVPEVRISSSSLPKEVFIWW
jgi:hypothetical protein